MITVTVIVIALVLAFSWLLLLSMSDSASNTNVQCMVRDITNIKDDIDSHSSRIRQLEYDLKQLVAKCEQCEELVVTNGITKCEQLVTKCDCGESFKGKFCGRCGKMRKDADA